MKTLYWPACYPHLFALVLIHYGAESLKILDFIFFSSCSMEPALVAVLPSATTQCPLSLSILIQEMGISRVFLSYCKDNTCAVLIIVQTLNDCQLLIVVVTMPSLHNSSLIFQISGTMIMYFNDKKISKSEHIPMTDRHI